MGIGTAIIVILGAVFILGILTGRASIREEREQKKDGR